jgi:hypothetical protein
LSVQWIAWLAAGNGGVRLEMTLPKPPEAALSGAASGP